VPFFNVHILWIEILSPNASWYYSLILECRILLRVPNLSYTFAGFKVLPSYVVTLRPLIETTISSAHFRITKTVFLPSKLPCCHLLLA